MIKSKTTFVYILQLLFIIGVIGCSSDGNEGLDNTQKAEKKTVSVEVIKLAGENYTDYISVVGTVKPLHKALLSSSEGGEITSIFKDKGNYVKRGDTILVIDNRILGANLMAAKAQYEMAEIMYEKQKMIFDENVNSEIQYLDSKYKKIQLKANYDLIKTRYNNTFIVAPFSGIIENKYFELSELAPARQPIVNLIDISSIIIKAGVPEIYVDDIKVGTKALINVKAIPDAELAGKITFVGTSISTDNRTFPIEVTLKNKGRRIKPELIAEVLIEHASYENVIVIPNEVVSRVDKSYEVYVVENEKARSRHIKFIRRTANKIAVSTGLKEGEKLVVVGYQNLIDGQAVNVVQ